MIVPFRSLWRIPSCGRSAVDVNQEERGYHCSGVVPFPRPCRCCHAPSKESTLRIVVKHQASELGGRKLLKQRVLAAKHHPDVARSQQCWQGAFCRQILTSSACLAGRNTFSTLVVSSCCLSGYLSLRCFALLYGPSILAGFVLRDTVVVNLCFRLGAYCIDHLILPCTPVWRTEQRASTCA